jgi:ribosomal protein L37AE/L43A
VQLRKGGPYMSEIRTIHDVEELRSLEHKEQFQFTCEKCGKTCTVKRALSVNKLIQ